MLDGCLIIQSHIYRLLPDIAISLCGGLDKDKEDSFSPALFEQGLISFDDFEMHLRNPSTAVHKDLFSNPDLVVRIGERYYRWPDAVPVVMSVVLYGRPLPPELADKGAKVMPPPPPSTEASLAADAAGKEEGLSPNSKKSSSWWPFGSSRREAEQQQQQQQPLEDVKSGEEEAAPAATASTNQEDNNNKAVKFETGPEEETTLEAAKDDEKEKSDSPAVKADEVTPKKRTDSSEGESDPDLQALSEGIRCRKFKKSLRLSSEDIVSLKCSIVMLIANGK